MRVRKIWAPLLILGAIGLVVTALFLRRTAPPEPARLLPDSDAIIYVNAGLIRRFVPVEDRNIHREPDYEAFIQATGFVFERDLDEAALALHLPASPGARPRFSHILVGRFDRDRALAYLKGLATSVERQGDTDIYLVPREDRTLRVAILNPDTIALSNHDNPAMVRGIIDRYHKAAMPFAGPPLLREHYRNVPFAAPVWAIARVPAASGTKLEMNLDVANLLQQFAGGTTMVASLRYLGDIEFRAQAFAPSEEQAKRIAERYQTFLDLYRTYERVMRPAGSDPDVKEFVDSIEVQQEGAVATLNATVSEAFVRKAISTSTAVPAAAPSQQPAPSAPAEKPAPTEKPAPKRGPDSSKQ